MVVFGVAAVDLAAIAIVKLEAVNDRRVTLEQHAPVQTSSLNGVARQVTSKKYGNSWVRTCPKTFTSPNSMISNSLKPRKHS